MKVLLICLAALLWAAPSAVAQVNPHRDSIDMTPPIFRGEGIVNTKSDSHQMERQTTDRIPLDSKGRAPDLAQIKHDADELSRLAQSVSNEVAATEKGTLPKDLNGDLKQIQKLSKRLRDELKL